MRVPYLLLVVSLIDNEPYDISGNGVFVLIKDLLRGMIISNTEPVFTSDSTRMLPPCWQIT
jgi:hypothetical protein